MQSVTGIMAPTVKMNDSNHEAFLRQIGLTGKDVELFNLETEEQMLQLK